MTTFLFMVGAALLIGGAESLVRGASRLATAAGLSPLVVGLTVVAFGTSAPELAVTMGAAVSGRADVAIGNVVGSNIGNVLLILGLSAAVAPLVVSSRLVRFDVPLMIAASVCVYLLALDGAIGRIEGVLLAVGAVAYTVRIFGKARRSDVAETPSSAPVPRPAGGRVRSVVEIVVGLVLLVVGARWVVQGAVAAAATLGVSELVVGLTIVAMGTSLPELATSVMASIRGERDLAVGNIVGSNLFNLLVVLGLGSVATPGGIPVSSAVLAFDLPVMTAVAVACLPVFFTGYAIARWEGWLFLGYYAAYTVYLILAASRHDALPMYGWVMLGFVVPLTGVTLGVLAVRAAR